MVLSNKKLKQRLRAELLSKAVNESGPKSGPDAILKPESLRTLLNSATQKPRLSKREKKRKVLSVDGSDELKKKPDESGEEQRRNDKESQVDGGTNEEKRKKKKEKKKENRKRKREEEEGAVDVKESGSSGQKIGKNKKKKKRQKQQQKKKEKKENEKGGEIPEIDNATYSQANGDASTKVYVGGIPYSYAEEDIQYYFQSCGSIVGVDCMKFPDTGKFRGIAIISFETEAGAKNALMYDRAEMGGLQLTIQPYKSTRVNRASGFAPKMVEGYNRVYVGNLSWDITEDDLKKFFSDCSISSIRFGMDKESGEFKGYAHVDFSDSVSVAMALKLDQEYVCGRPVKISCAVPPKGGTVRTISLPDNKTNNEVKSLSTPLAASNEVSDGAVAAAAAATAAATATATATNAKIRRRTCYECGEKGHLSSACPKKQNVDPAKASTI